MHLRIEPDCKAETKKVQACIESAEDWAQRFLARRVFKSKTELEKAQKQDLDALPADEAERIRKGIVAKPSIKAGTLLMVGHLYENRENAVIGAPVSTIPNGAEYLLYPYRIGLGV